MVLEEQKEHLYDFLYIDRDKIISFYTQIFGGYLKKFEKTFNHQKTTERQYSLGVGIAKSKFDFIHNSKEGKKEIFDPHDILFNLFI